MTDLQCACNLGIVLLCIQPPQAREVVQSASGQVCHFHPVQVPARLMALVVVACMAYPSHRIMPRILGHLRSEATLNYVERGRGSGYTSVQLPHHALDQASFMHLSLRQEQLRTAMLTQGGLCWDASTRQQGAAKWFVLVSFGQLSP